jgi:hypothetical protein
MYRAPNITSWLKAEQTWACLDVELNIEVKRALWMRENVKYKKTQ